MGEESETAKRYNHVLNIIDNRLIPDEGAKKARGEVFTPLCLVREMLFGLRKSALEAGKTQLCDGSKKMEIQGEIWGLDKDGDFIDDKETDRVGGIPPEVWRNCNSTFLDPANGIGNFPVVAFYMLDYQLGKHQKIRSGDPDLRGDKNKEKRRKHIVKNMLYMIELNKGNVNTSRKIFEKIVPGATANIICANTLKLDSLKIKENFKINQFDVIMGNPPYNSGGIRSKVGGKEGIESIWQEFIEKGIKWLNPNGFLIFITPNTWIELKANISEKILEKQILCLRSYNVVEAHKLFSNQSGEIPIAYFCLENSNTKNDTFIFDKCSNNFIEFNIYKNNYIPSEGINLIKKILKVSKKYGNLSKYFKNTQTKDKSLIKNNITGSYIYPLINISYGKIIITYTSKCYTNHNNKIKLVFPNFSMGYPIFDEYGIIEPAANMMFTLYNDKEENLKKIQALFYTNIVFFIIISLKTKQKFMSNRIFDILPDIINIPDFPKEITDYSLYNYFKFSKEEIHCIEEYKMKGEGRLTNEKVSAFTNFDITKTINKSNIDMIKENIDLCLNKVKLPKTRKAKKGGAKPHNKTRKIKKSF